MNFPSTPPLDNTELRQKVEPLLPGLEAERQKELNKSRSAMLYCALGGIVLGAIAAVFLIWLGLIPLGIALIVYLFIAGKAKHEYATGFKAMVMPPLVAAFGDLNFNGSAGIGFTDFVAANLHGRPDRYSSEDLIYGKIGQTEIRFCEATAEEQRTRTDSNGNTETYYVTTFKGLFFIADFNKQFNGHTFIVPEGVSGSLGSFGAKLQSLGGKFSGRGELVKLESPEFERQFIVYSSDQTEARYILSSNFMERLLALKNRYNNQVAASFQGGSIYVMISNKQNFFEPPSLSTPLTFDSLQDVISQLALTTSIVSDLDLNTRIWTKE